MFFPCLQPVYLRALVASDAGMINCCNSSPLKKLCFQVPPHYLELLSMLPDNNFVDSQFTTDRYYSPSKLLHAAPIQHDPYTPDSMDSPSPSAFTISELQECEQSSPNAKKRRQGKIQFDMAVSPALLKSKLELIVKIEEKAKLEKQQKNIVETRLSSWPVADKQYDNDKRKRCYSDISWMKRTWFYDKATKSSPKSASDSSPVAESVQCHLIIPRIAIINPSNFQSNESSVNIQDERLIASYRRLSLGKDATSGEGSSLELDISDDRQDFEKDNDKVYSRTQDSGLDTLDVEDAFSRGGSLGLSSNETTSTLPLDLEETPTTLERHELMSEGVDCEKIELNTRDIILDSKDTTRSHSMHSEGDNEVINLKTSKVDRKCRKRIVDEHSRGEKCCCIIC